MGYAVPSERPTQSPDTGRDGRAAGAGSAYKGKAALNDICRACVRIKNHERYIKVKTP
jgi:hypothetical protein